MGSEKESKIEVNIWDGSTLLEKIDIPEFVIFPDILIIDEVHYMRVSDNYGTSGINYAKADTHIIKR